MSHGLVARLAERHPVQRVCKVLGVSRSGYYARRARETPARVREDRRLKQQILAVHTEAQGRYGTPRIERVLRRRGVATSRKRVARLRRELGLRAKGRRRFRLTTNSEHAYPPAHDLELAFYRPAEGLGLVSSTGFGPLRLP
ncbi:MAG: IS3 family transposase [Thermoanaerobaculia bacterium]